MPNDTPSIWSDLTIGEKNILEHLVGINSGVAQTLTVKIDECVLVETNDKRQGLATKTLNVQAPTADQFVRIKTFCLRNPDEIITLEASDSSLTIRGVERVKAVQ